MAEDCGTNHAGHARGIERTLRGLADGGARQLSVAHGTVADFAAFAEGEGRPPEAEGLRATYAARLAADGRAQSWPQRRNEACWCGSGRTYKKCGPGLR